MDTATTFIGAIVIAGSLLLTGYGVGRRERKAKRSKKVIARRANRQLPDVQWMDDLAAAFRDDCVFTGCTEPSLAESGLCMDHDLLHRGQPDDEPTAPDDEPELVGRQRFAYRPDGVAPAVAMRAEQQILHGEANRLDQYGQAILPSTELFADHFESEAMTAEVQKILADARWGLLEGGELTAAVVRAQPGAPTGQYPIVVRKGGVPVPPDVPPSPQPTSPPKQVGLQGPPKPQGPPPSPIDPPLPPYVPVIRDREGAAAAIKTIAKAGASR